MSEDPPQPSAVGIAAASMPDGVANAETQQPADTIPQVPINGETSAEASALAAIKPDTDGDAEPKDIHMADVPSEQVAVRLSPLPFSSSQCICPHQ